MHDENIIRYLNFCKIIRHAKCQKFLMVTSSNGNIFRFTGHFCGDFTSLVNSPHKGQWRRALMFSLICAWINGWENNGEAGDLRRHRAHYDLTVMLCNLPYLRRSSYRDKGTSTDYWVPQHSRYRTTGTQLDCSIWPPGLTFVIAWRTVIGRLRCTGADHFCPFNLEKRSKSTKYICQEQTIFWKFLFNVWSFVCTWIA